MIKRTTMNKQLFKITSHLIVVSTFLLSTFSCLCYAKEDAARENDQALEQSINKLLKISGVMDQLDSFHSQVLKAIPGDAFPNGRMKRKAKKITKNMAGKEALVLTVYDVFKNNHNHVLMNKTMEFFESKLGKKVGRLVANINHKHGRNLKSSARKAESRISQKRRHALERIVLAQEIGSRNCELTLSLMNGLLESDTSQQGFSQKIIWKRLEEIENKVQAMQSRTNELSVELFSYVFQSLGDEELESLARFQESEAGKWYSSTLHKTYLKVSHDMGKALAYAIGAPGPDEEENQ